MEGAHRSGVDPPPPPRSPHSHPQRAHPHPHAPPSFADLLLPATFLAITVAGILFVLLILIIWLHSLNKAKKYDKPSKIPMDERQITQHFKVIVENADDFEFKLPSDLKYIDEERDGSGHVSPKLMNMKKSGGSSPKIPGNDEEPGDSGDSTPGSAKSKGGNSRFVFPPSEEGAGTSKPKADGKKMKVALPEQQWILHRKPPLDWRGYNINIPNKTFGLSDVVRADLAVDSASSADTSRKYSATRSPSLEKDEKSPFPVGLKNDVPIVFGFGSDVSKKVLESSGVKSGDSSPVVQVRVQPLATDSHCVAFDAEQSRSKPGKVPDNKTVISRRFGPSNTGLHINTTLENVNQSFGVEKSEVQHSPRLSDSAVGKENNPSPRFSFSPKFFATPDSKSPKFFGTPDQKSPKFFATLDSKSPAFFAENQSRNASPRSFSSDRMSPRLMSTSSFKSVQSPLIIGNADGECFRFDRSELDSNKTVTQEDLDSVFPNKKESYDDESLEPYNPKTDLEKPVEDSDKTSNEDRILNNVVESTESVHSCPRIISSISIPSSDKGFLHKVNDNKTEHCNEITLDASHLTATSDEQALQNINNEHTVQKKPTLNTREESTDSLVIPNSGNTANYRRQRLKSISLDSDNAKFIEQNLGIPIVKHLKHENLYDPCNNSKEEECADYNIEVTSPRIISKASYFKFDDDENNVYKGYDNGNDPRMAIVHQTFTTVVQSDDLRVSPDIVSPVKFLRDNSTAIAFSEMQPRFSPKEFDAFSTDDEKISKNKNIRNLTIDINKRDSELEKELMEYDCLDSGEKRLTPKTPTLKIKATSLDSSENLNLSLPVTNTLQVPQNSISVPNTPKRQMKRTLSQKSGKLVKSSHYNINNYCANLNDLGLKSCQENQQRKLFMSVKCPSTYVDSGIYLRENHANLMLFQASKYPLSRSFNSNSSNFSRRMGSFDENMVDLSETGGNRLSLHKPCDNNLLGSNLLGFKQNLSVSSTNLKTLPEGVPSNDFDTHPANEKCSKKTLLQRRGSNQSLTINLDATGSNLKYSTLSLQGSNLSLASFGASSHNLNNIKNSASNFSLNTDNRQKKNILERRNSNTSLTLNLDCTPQHGRLYTGSNCNLQGSHYSLTNNENITVVPGKKCLLQRRGSNTSLTLNLQGSVNSNLDRCTSNSSLNIQNEAKVGKKKGLLERRSSNTSLTLNINNSNSQFDSNRVLSVSNYNLDGSGCTLSRYNSNQSINNAEKKGLLERRSSNTSLTLNLNSSNYNLQGCAGDVMRDIEIDETVIQNNLVSNASQQKEKHRKSLSTENLFPKSYKSRVLHCKNSDNVYSFGSHDNLWSNSYASESFSEQAEIAGCQNLTYVCGDQDNEMIYAFGDRQHMEQAGLQGSIPIKNITTKPLSPHSTSEDFKMYLANIQHLQNASNTLTRQQLKDLNTVFQDGYSKGVCSLMNKKSPTDILTSQLTHLMLDRLNPDNESSNEGEYNPQRLLPEPVLPCLEYQKTLLRNLHQEFWDLPTNFQEKPMVFGSHPKNRYKTILPNEHSRVILRPEVGETDEGYINANYIKGHEYSKNCYIATQGPLQNTTYDFWLMVYQNSCQFYKDGCTKTNEDRHFGSPQGRGKKTQDSPEKSPDSQAGIQKIVMLTNLIENGRQKCEKYFPLELNEEMTFKQLPNSSYSSACSGGSFFPENNSVDDKLDESEANSFKIKNVGITNKTGYTIRKLLIEYTNKFVKTMKDCDSEKGRVIPNINSERNRISESVEIIVDEPQVDLSGEKDNSHQKVNSLVVYHYWFDNWADHKCPKDVTALLDLSMDVVQNRMLNFEEFDDQSESGVASNNRPSRSDFTKAKSFDKPEIANPHKSNMDKSMTYFDFSTYSSNSDSIKDVIDMDGVPRERRPSAFQLAKAFFDEVAKANTEDQMNTRPGRKNSLASRLDLPKNRHDLATRRESTGRIDSKLHQSKKSAHNASNEGLKPSFANKDNKSVAEKSNDEDLKEMPPIIVHCSAGIGRTGCLIAILNGIRQMKADQRVDILGIVCNMRLNRGGMVQNSEQYELIHKVLCLYEELGLPDVG